MRSAFALDGRGNLQAAWPTDNRDFEQSLFRRADVYAARLPALPGAPAEPRLEPRKVPELKAAPIHPRETEDVARIRRYTIESGGNTYRIYRGDTHRHTEFSMDGKNDGALLDCYRYALDAASLDFLGVTDHNSMGGPDVEYINWMMQQTADLFMLPKTFTPLYSYERSVGYPNGHRNVYFARRGNPTLPVPPAEQKAATGAGALYEYLKRFEGLTIPHTSASSMGTDWRDNNPVLEPLVEIYQGDPVSSEYEGAPKAGYPDNPASANFSFRPAGYVWNAWADGRKVFRNESQNGLTFAAMREAARTDAAIAERVKFFLYRVPEELYDFQADPDALRNLAGEAQYKPELERLRRLLAEHLARTKDPVLEAFSKKV